MTFSNQTNRTSATGTGSTGQEIPFSFPINLTSDLTVYKLVTATGVQSTLGETTNYTVTITGNTGGTVTTVTAVETTEQIHLVRNTPFNQETDLEQGGAFTANTVEAMADKNAKLNIENKDRFDNKAILFPETDSSSLTNVLPSSIDRASKNLTFDSSGNVTASDSVETGSVSFTTFGTNMAEAANALAGKSVINLNHVYDVTDYGADSTGVSAADVEIQLAIDACSAAGGGIVWFPEGNYLLENALVGTTNVNMVGEGIDVVFLEADSTLTDYMIKYIGTSGAKKSYFRVSDMTLDGNSETGPSGGIHINWCFHVLFERLNIKLFFNDAAIGLFTQNAFHVDHIKCVGNMGGGTAPDGAACFKVWDTDGSAGENISQISFYGCQAINSTVGILIPTAHANDGITIDNCGFGGHDTAGVSFGKGNGGLRILSSHFETMDGVGESAILGEGVSANGSKGIDILGNRFADCTTAINLRNLGRVSIRNNAFSGTVAGGYTITSLGSESILRLDWGDNWIDTTTYTTFTGDDPRTTAFIADDATPNVGIGPISRIYWFETNCDNATDITDFDAPTKGQVIGIIGKDSSLSTIKHDVTKINLQGGIDLILANNAIIVLQHDGADWNEVSRSENDNSGLVTIAVDIDADEIKALAASPKELVAAPGGNRYLEFVSAVLILDDGTNYDDAASDGNMVIRYTDGDGVVVSEEIEADGFIDAGADTITNAVPVKDAIVATSASVNKALVLDNNGNEYTTGTGVLVVKITYRTHKGLGL